MGFRHISLATALVAAPLAASADQLNGIYVGVGGGVDFHGDNQSVNGPTPSLGIQLPSKSTNIFGNGGIGLASIGYGFGNGLRTEFEFSYQQNPVLRNVTGPTYHGDERQYSFMLNGLYDVDLGFPIKPFVGAGAGFSIISWNPVNRTLNNIICCAPFFGVNSPVFGANNPVNVTNNANDADIVAAVQLMAGASYEIPGVPGLSLSAQYRWFDAPHNIQISNFLTLTPVNGKGPVLSGQGATTYSGHIDQSIIIGLTYAFNAPRPAVRGAATPVAVPPSPISRSYLVFFDWDKAVLTDRARQIVSEAASASTKVQLTRIEVNGYTDTSGTPKYNQGLSLARAKTVMAELVKDGVPAGSIAIMGYGETHLLVQTGAGVREPQNRRVEIVMK